MNNKKVGFVLSLIGVGVAAFGTIFHFVKTGTWSAEGCSLCAINTAITCLFAGERKRVKNADKAEF